jgi:hypothetical protein
LVIGEKNMKYAIIENNTVVNVAVANTPLADNWIASEVAAIGDTYENGQFIKPEPDPIAAADVVRAERNRLLDESDWTQLEDAIVDKQAWVDYRQALRDVPQQAGFPWTINWPTKLE